MINVVVAAAAAPFKSCLEVVADRKKQKDFELILFPFFSSNSCIKGLPDGIFSNQKSKFGEIFGGPGDGKCWFILWPVYGSLVYFIDIW
jgi:hypothetical protein